MHSSVYAGLCFKNVTKYISGQDRLCALLEQSYLHVTLVYHIFSFSYNINCVD